MIEEEIEEINVIGTLLYDLIRFLIIWKWLSFLGHPVYRTDGFSPDMVIQGFNSGEFECQHIVLSFHDNEMRTITVLQPVPCKKNLFYRFRT